MRAAQILRRFVSPHLTKVHAKRRQAVFDVIDALVSSGRLSSAAMGRAIPGKVAPKHHIKKVDRLLGNVRLRNDLITFFAALAAVVLRKEQPLLLVDWTRLSGDFCALVAAVPLGGRALPIYFEVHPLPQWHNEQVQNMFLRRLSAHILPRRCTPILVTDAGYRPSWFAQVASLGWHFLGPLNPTTKTSADGRTWQYCRDFYGQARYKPRSLGEQLISKYRRVHGLLVSSKARRKGRRGPPAHKRASVKQAARRKATQPCVLATSLTSWSARDLVSLYRKRMQIEESFRDAKSHRFGWSLVHARSKRRERWSALLLLASLGMFAMHIFGWIAEQQQLHFRYQANTIRDRRVLSTFTLGLLLAERGEATFSPAELQAAVRSFADRVAAQPRGATSAFSCN